MNKNKQKTKTMYVGAVMLLVLVLGSVASYGSAYFGGSDRVTSPVKEQVEIRETNSVPEIIEDVATEEISIYPVPEDNYPLEVRWFGVKLNPSEQITENGVGTYEVTVKNLHSIPTCVNDGNIACAPAFRSYQYELSYEVEGTGVRAEFSENNFYLMPGEEKTVKMTVIAENKDLHEFNVIVNSVNDGNKEISKWGVLLYQTDVVTYETLFEGQGYILDSENNKFYSVDLEILSEGTELSGTFELIGIEMEIDGNIYAHGGSSNGNEVYMIEFDLVYMDNVVGSFEGEIKKSGTLRTIDGIFQGNMGNEWRLIGFM